MLYHCGSLLGYICCSAYLCAIEKGREWRDRDVRRWWVGLQHPVYLILKESHDIFPDQKINALVSVGTGAKTPRSAGSNLVSLAKKVAEMATDASREAEDFSSFLAALDPHLHDVYFRFDANSALSTIPLQEWRMLAIIS